MAGEKGKLDLRLFNLIKNKSHLFFTGKTEIDEIIISRVKIAFFMFKASKNSNFWLPHQL